MDQNIQDFIDGKRIAVVGASRDSKKFGNTAYKELKQRGYQVYAVNPSATEINVDPCYPNLAALKDKVDGVLVTVPPAKGMEVLHEASQVGLRNVWIQQQGDSPEELALASQLGLNVISGKCILMYAAPVRSYHKWHRGFIKLVGKL